MSQQEPDDRSEPARTKPSTETESEATECEPSDLLSMRPGDTSYFDVLDRWQAASPEMRSQAVSRNQELVAEAQSALQARMEELEDEFRDKVYSKFHPAPCQIHQWGFYGYDGGSGEGGMLFADSKAEVLEKLRLWVFYCCDGAPMVDRIETRAYLMTVLDAYNSGTLSWDELLPSFDDALRSYFRLEWLGPLEELRSEDTPFAREHRSSFRRQASHEPVVEPAASAPIADHELQGFLKFLWDPYGMYAES